jgi:hypothetical protein
MHSLDELVSVLDRLIARLDELENRVVALERRAAGRSAISHADAPPPQLKTLELTTGISFQVAAAAAPAPESAKGQEPVPVASAGSASTPAPAAITAPHVARPPAAQHPLKQMLAESGGGVAPVIGKVVLGMAGAYVLRSLAESGPLPQLAVVSIGLLYAGSWLLWAARVSPGARFAGAAYAATSAFIGAPMLWELTVRFKVLPDALTAVLLVLFVVTATVLAWKRQLTSIAWIASFASSFTSVGLLAFTRDPSPFFIALIVIALLTEAAACLGHTFKSRALVAAALDLATAAVIVVYTSEQGVPAEYSSLSNGLLLAFVLAPLLIYGAGVAYRNVVRHRTISVFDIGQTVVAFLIGAFGITRGPQSTWRPEFGSFCIAAAVACYFVAYARSQDPAHRREYHVFSCWAALLFIAGAWLLLPTGAFSIVVAVAAFGAAWISARSRRFTPPLHAFGYLLAACYSSGLLMYYFDLLFDGLPPKPSFNVILIALLTLGCSWAVWQLRGDQWQHRLVRLSFTILATFCVAAFAILGTISVLWRSAPPDAPRLAVARTLVLCATGLALALFGSKFTTPELVWTAYGVMALCTLKLLFEDLRTGSTGSMAASLFLYGMVWLILPRLVRSRAAA